MAEYIDREKVLEEFEEWVERTGYLPKGTSYYYECRGCIEDVPAADVVEVKHGKWEENRYAFCNVCSECGTIVDRIAIKWQSGELNFCPNCGAKMKGEDK